MSSRPAARRPTRKARVLLAARTAATNVAIPSTSQAIGSRAASSFRSRPNDERDAADAPESKVLSQECRTAGIHILDRQPLIRLPRSSWGAPCGRDGQRARDHTEARNEGHVGGEPSGSGRKQGSRGAVIRSLGGAALLRPPTTGPGTRVLRERFAWRDIDQTELETRLRASDPCSIGARCGRRK